MQINCYTTSSSTTIAAAAAAALHKAIENCPDSRVVYLYRRVRGRSSY